MLYTMSERNEEWPSRLITTSRAQELKPCDSVSKQHVSEHETRTISDLLWQLSMKLVLIRVKLNKLHSKMCSIPAKEMTQQEE